MGVSYLHRISGIAHFSDVDIMQCCEMENAKRCTSEKYLDPVFLSRERERWGQQIYVNLWIVDILTISAERVGLSQPDMQVD